jgi:hypothetical protein
MFSHKNTAIASRPRLELWIKGSKMDLIAWIKEKHEQQQQEKWENSTTTMKERNPNHIMNTFKFKILLFISQGLGCGRIN